MNKFGAKLYMDLYNYWIVKMEDILSPFEREVWTTYQGDQYIGQKGEHYVLTNFFEEMDPFGKIILEEQRLAQSKLIFKPHRQPLESQVRC